MERPIWHFPYGLTDPRYKGIVCIRYIGVTTNLNRRYSDHLRCPKEALQEKNYWIQELVVAGLEPGLVVFDPFKAMKRDKEFIEKKEDQWIQHFRSLGANLLNICGNTGELPGSIVLPDAVINFLLSIGEPD